MNPGRGMSYFFKYGQDTETISKAEWPARISYLQLAVTATAAQTEGNTRCWGPWWDIFKIK
jgi:hypothetical protein